MQEGLVFYSCRYVLKPRLVPSTWTVNVHMTRDTPMLIELPKQKSGKVTFGDNGYSNIFGLGRLVRIL